MCPHFTQGRNRFRGPEYFDSDLTIIKNTKLPGWENARLGFGFQLFTLFNHPNFSFPDYAVSDSPLRANFWVRAATYEHLGERFLGRQCFRKDGSIESPVSVLIVTAMSAADWPRHAIKSFHRPQVAIREPALDRYVVTVCGCASRISGPFTSMKARAGGLAVSFRMKNSAMRCSQ
jgi:hypothetical protein